LDQIDQNARQRQSALEIHGWEIGCLNGGAHVKG